MAEIGEGKINQGIAKPPTFGVDTIDSLKPPSKAKLEKEARSAGAHGHIVQIPPSPVESLVLQIQDIPSSSPSGSTERPKNLSRIKKQPLKPGDPMPLSPGVVLLDENGREVGILDKRRTDLVLESIIRDGRKAPIFVLRTPEGTIIRASKKGPTWVGHKRR